MLNILLINPSNRDNPLENVRPLELPPMNLALLAGCTPEQYEIAIVDETMEEVDFDAEVDLAGITCMTALAPRAYGIAKEFKKRGVPVVMGGIHASIMPEEAGQFADAVVIGEAEEIWPSLLEDAMHDRLRPIYPRWKEKLIGSQREYPPGKDSL